MSELRTIEPKLVELTDFQQKTYTLFNCLMTSSLMLEYLDQLKETKFYRHRLKHTAKMFEEEIEKHTQKAYANSHSSDEEMSNNLTDNLDFLIKELSILPPQELMLVRGLIVDFLDNKDKYADKAVIYLKKINT